MATELSRTSKRTRAHKTQTTTSMDKMTSKGGSAGTTTKAAGEAAETALSDKWNSWASENVDLILSICAAGVVFTIISMVVMVWFLKWRHRKAREQAESGVVSESAGKTMQIGAPMPAAGELETSMYPHFGAIKPMPNEYSPNQDIDIKPTPNEYPPIQDIDIASISQQSYEELHGMGSRASHAFMSAQQRHESGLLTPHHAKRMQTLSEDYESNGTIPGQSYGNDDRFSAAPGDACDYPRVPQSTPTHDMPRSRQSVPDDIISVYSPTERTRYT